MVTALAPSGPVAPVVPTSPPSNTGTTQSAQRESFQDVYGHVATEEDSKGDAGSKQKAIDPAGSKASKKTADGSEGSEKTPVAAIASPQGFVLQRAPLGLVFLGQNAAQPPAVDSATVPGDQSLPVEVTGDAAVPGGLPNFDIPLAKPDQTAAMAQVPSGEKLAFSVQLTQPDIAKSPVPVPRIATPQLSRPLTTSETRAATGPQAAASPKDAYQMVDSKKTNAAEIVLPSREAASATVLDLRPNAAPLQAAEPSSAPSSRTLAIQDVQPTMPELPKPPATTEILLQLAGKDQSTASVRVVDRSGTVNVTVHAADAELRSSLRSNLGELASQLTGQGFKTEVAKPALIAANAENQHDSRHGGQNSGSQQHNQFSQDSRQPQRDRRANSELWRDELEQETSGTAGTPGGKS